MAALPYIVLIQNIYNFIAAVYIVYINARLLLFLQKNTTKNSAIINSTITPTILLHIFTWFFRSILTIIYQIYLIINWRPSFSYNIDTYFYFNSFELILSFVIQMPPLLIAIERITILLSNPSTYVKLRLCIVFSGIAIQFFSSIICAIVYFSNKVDVMDNEKCWTTACMFSPSGAIFFTSGKLILSTVYLIVATVCLIVLFKWNHKHIHSKYNVGKLIHQTIYAEFAFNLAPNFLTAFCRYILKIEPSFYGGNFVKVGIITGGLFNSYIISRAPAFKKQFQKNVLVANQS